MTMRFNINRVGVAGAALLICAYAHADILHVHPGDSIQAAIISAQPDDEIIVHPGTYHEALDTLGKALHLHSQGGPDTVTIDAAGLGTSALTCANGESESTIIEGFTITHGDAVQGGGMFLYETSPAIHNCIFRTNAADYGAGVFNSHGCPTFTECAFDQNTARASGGGLYNYNFTGEPTATLHDCAFTDNTALSAGGAMRNWDSNPTLTACAFTENHARYFGAGIANGGTSAPTISRCLFQWNRTDTLFTNFDAHGGAVSNTDTSQPLIVNSIFDGNSAHAMQPWLSFGGAVSCTDQAHPTLVNCTLIANHANLGDGLYAGGNALASIANSIVWDSTSAIVAQRRGSFDIRYSNIRSGWPGPGNINIDPQLALYTLPPNSPCIDAGDNTIPALAAITTDYAGQPRFVDDPTVIDTGLGLPPLIDLGANEFQPSPPLCPWDTAPAGGDNTIGLGDLNALLSHWGPCPDPPEDCPWDFAPNGGDQSVGLGDLNALLSNWGPCP